MIKIFDLYAYLDEVINAIKKSANIISVSSKTIGLDDVSIFIVGQAVEITGTDSDGLYNIASIDSINKTLTFKYKVTSSGLSKSFSFTSFTDAKCTAKTPTFLTASEKMINRLLIDDYYNKAPAIILTELQSESYIKNSFGNIDFSSQIELLFAVPRNDQDWNVSDFNTIVFNPMKLLAFEFLAQLPKINSLYADSFNINKVENWNINKFFSIDYVGEKFDYRAAGIGLTFQLNVKNAAKIC